MFWQITEQKSVEYILLAYTAASAGNDRAQIIFPDAQKVIEWF